MKWTEIVNGKEVVFEGSVEEFNQLHNGKIKKIELKQEPIQMPDPTEPVEVDQKPLGEYASFSLTKKTLRGLRISLKLARALVDANEEETFTLKQLWDMGRVNKYFYQCFSNSYNYFQACVRVSLRDKKYYFVPIKKGLYKLYKTRSQFYTNQIREYYANRKEQNLKSAQQ